MQLHFFESKITILSFLTIAPLESFGQQLSCLCMCWDSQNNTSPALNHNYNMNSESNCLSRKGLRAINNEWIKAFKKALPLSWSKGLSTRFVWWGGFYQLMNRKQLSEHTPTLGFAHFVLNLWNCKAANTKYTALILVMFFKNTGLSSLWFLKFITGLLHIIFFPFHTQSSAHYPTDNSGSQETVNGMNSLHNIPSYLQLPARFISYWNWATLLRAKFLILFSAWKLLLMSFF